MVISEELKDRNEGSIRAFLKNNKVLLAKLDSRLPIVVKKNEVKMKVDGPWADEFEAAVEKLSASDDTAWQIFVQIAIDNNLNFLVEKLKAMGVFCCNNAAEKKAKKFPSLFGTSIKSLSEVVNVFRHYYDNIAKARVPLTLEHLTTFIEWFTTIVGENMEEGEKLLGQITMARKITMYTNVDMVAGKRVIATNQEESSLIRKFYKNLDQLYLYEDTINTQARYNKIKASKPQNTPGWKDYANSITLSSGTFGVDYTTVAFGKELIRNKLDSRSGKLPEQTTNETTVSGSPGSFTGFPSMEARIEELRRASVDEVEAGNGGENSGIQDSESLAGKRNEIIEEIK